MRFINAIVSSAVIAITSSSVLAQSTAVQWTTASGGNGHWYEVVVATSNISWLEANEQSEQVGGYLSTLTTTEENVWVHSITLNAPDAWGAWGSGWVYGPWIGGHRDYLNDQVWVWVTGEPWSFTAWHSSQPDSNAQTVISFGGGGPTAATWADTSTDEPVHSYITEWSADCNADGIVDYGQCLNGTLPDYNGNNIPDCCDQGVACVAGNYPVQWRVTDGGNDHWYQGVTTQAPVSWTSARARAVALGSQLATIGSRAEDDFVARLALENPLVWPIAVGYGPWLGGYQTSPSTNPFANWAWVTGEPWSYVSDVVEFDNSSRPDGQTDDYLHYINHSRVWNDVRNDGDTYYNSIGIRSYMAEWSADCNADGIVDYGQILSGQLIDANSNGIPDVCQQLVPIHQFDFDMDLHDSVGAATGQFQGNCRVENGALIADGTDSYVEFDQYLIPSTGSVTVAMWVKSELGQGIHEFISQGQNNNSFFLGRNYLGTDRFRVGDQWFQTNTPYDWICGSWHHVAVVVNRATDRTQLWVDAQLKEERIGAISITSVGTGTKTRLCAQYCCGEFFRGKLDQLRIYASALTGPTLAEIVATSGYPCPGDISGNNSVDGVDLAAILGTWGTNGQGEFDCDIDNDGIVGGTDLTIILGGWGPCPN